MAAARSPCRCFKPRVLHFKVKNTPLKDKKWKKKVQKNAQLSFCGGREAFHQEIVLRGIQPCFLHRGAHGLFWKATKAAKLLLNFQVHFFALYGQDNYFLKGNLCILNFFKDILQIFLFSANEKFQKVPRFEMDFVLNFAMCSVDFTRVNGSMIQIVFPELL